ARTAAARCQAGWKEVVTREVVGASSRFERHRVASDGDVARGRYVSVRPGRLRQVARDDENRPSLGTLRVACCRIRRIAMLDSCDPVALSSAFWSDAARCSVLTKGAGAEYTITVISRKIPWRLQ